MSVLSKYLKTQFNPKRPTSAILALKKNKDGMLDELELATSFLNLAYPEITINQRLYHYINQIGRVLTCEYCGKPRAIKEKNARIISSHANPKLQGHYITTCASIECKKKHNLVKTEDGVMKKHGVKNISQTEQWHQKIQKTNQERYGVNYQTQSNNFKEKTKQTNLEKYGCKSYTQTQEYLDKKEYACLKKYGVKHPTQNKEVMDKIQETNLKKYGNRYVLQNKAIREKGKNTCIQKYGVEHHMHNEEFFEKTKHKFMKFKEFEFPSGKKIKVQGYEAFALSDLILEGTLESTIITNNKEMTCLIGKIMYTDLNGTVRRYYPDIYISSTHTIVEVKSAYTYACSKEINNIKKKATLNMGINFEFWIYHPNGKLIEKIV